MRTAETEYNERPVSPEHALWIAVLDQAISDALFRPNMKTIERHAATPAALSSAARHIAIERKCAGLIDAAKSILLDESVIVAKRSKELTLSAVTRERDEARDWLLGNTKDFRDVCYFAGMDPDKILERMQDLARLHWVLDDITRKKVTHYRNGYCKPKDSVED